MACHSCRKCIYPSKGTIGKTGSGSSLWGKKDPAKDAKEKEKEMKKKEKEDEKKAKADAKAKEESSSVRIMFYLFL